MSQLRVVLWRHALVRSRTTWSSSALHPALSLCLAAAIYRTAQLASEGWLELALLPLGALMPTAERVVALAAERSSGLVDVLRVMGLRGGVYELGWAADACGVGAAVAASVGAVSAALGLFAGAGAAGPAALVLAFSAANGALCSLLAELAASPRAAGQVALAAQFLQFACAAAALKAPRVASRAAWCVLPHVGLVLGASSFRGDAPGLPAVCAMLVAAAVAYGACARALAARRRDRRRPAAGDAATATNASGVAVEALVKRFDGVDALRGMTFAFEPSTIFALLGPNGAGKTTTVGCLAGLVDPDAGAARVFGRDARAARGLTGLCGQRDSALLETLTAREHVAFYASLKGGARDDAVLRALGLARDADRVATELSGGGKRKLSVAVALCGGSRFVVLDEPSAGLDALARRALWDALRRAKAGRCVLLTTHHLDEAAVLGDAIGIAVRGALVAKGGAAELRRTYGSGYEVVARKTARFDDGGWRAVVGDGAAAPTFDAAFAAARVADAPRVAPLLRRAEAWPGVDRCAVSLASLEEAYLVASGDGAALSTVDEARASRFRERRPPASFALRAAAVARKRLRQTTRAPTASLVATPAAFAAVAAVGVRGRLVTADAVGNAVGAAFCCAAGWVAAPALLAESLVRERRDGCRGVLAVAGADRWSYGLGTWAADVALLAPVAAACAGALALAAPSAAAARRVALVFLCAAPLVAAYAHAAATFFSSPSACLGQLPPLQLFQAVAPQILILAFFLVDAPIAGDDLVSLEYWLCALAAPQAAVFVHASNFLVSAADDVPTDSSYAPPLGAVLAATVAQACFFVGVAAARSAPAAAAPGPPVRPKLADGAVAAEAAAVAATAPGARPLVVDGLGHAYGGGPDVLRGVSFRVAAGECFGLLGCNGAGKSTIISSALGFLAPRAGAVALDGRSVGVVPQADALFDDLDCRAHVDALAALRGFSGDRSALVDGVLDALALPTRGRASTLSGGTRRRLSVALALVGDPRVVLLDEPSNGLDPRARRDLWNVVRATRARRAVVLTTHDMDEVEALCDRAAVLVAGAFETLGTVAGLKDALGDTYDVTATSTGAADDVHEAIVGIFPGAVLEDATAGAYRYRAPRRAAGALAAAFDALEAHRGGLLDDYAVSLPSMEAIFVSAVKRAAARAQKGNIL